MHSAPRSAPFTPLRLATRAGLEAEILPFRARLVALHEPARSGHMNVVLSHP